MCGPPRFARSRSAARRAATAKGRSLDRRIVIGAVFLLLVLAAIVIAVVGPGSDNGSTERSPAPAQVEPVQQTGNPADDGQSLADWLRANSG